MSTEFHFPLSTVAPERMLTPIEESVIAPHTLPPPEYHHNPRYDFEPLEVILLGQSRRARDCYDSMEGWAQNSSGPSIQKVRGTVDESVLRERLTRLEIADPPVGGPADRDTLVRTPVLSPVTLEPEQSTSNHPPQPCGVTPASPKVPNVRRLLRRYTVGYENKVSGQTTPHSSSPLAVNRGGQGWRTGSPPPIAGRTFNRVR